MASLNQTLTKKNKEDEKQNYTLLL